MSIRGSIIGGGSGIGADAARLLGERNYDVAVMSSGKGESLGIELGGLGFTGSNLEPDDLDAFVSASMGRFGRIDALENCTGHGAKGSLLEISDDDWHRSLDLYLLNVIRTARLVQPIMAKQGAGSIVNISTFAAFEPDPDFPTSSVFRAGLAAFAKLFCDQNAAAGIRMNNVLPGFVDSLLGPVVLHLGHRARATPPADVARLRQRVRPLTHRTRRRRTENLHRTTHHQSGTSS